MKISLNAVAAATLALTASLSQATVIDSVYTPLGGDSWMVDFTIANDGMPASFAGFSVDLPNATNLALVASPGTWDSLVFQQDAGLLDDGSLDSFVANPVNALAVGQSVGGFGVSFAYTAGATPGALPFMIYSDAFALLSVGTTTVTVVPEPAAVILAAFGLALVGLSTLRANAETCNSSRKVSA